MADGGSILVPTPLALLLRTATISVREEGCSPMTVLSDHCVLALQAATAAACAEALNAAPPSELWSHVLAVVNPVIRAHARKHMARISCAASLPDELLLGIFEHLPFSDRVRAAIVCQRWRTVSLDGVSALWTDIPHQRDVRTYVPLLARARGLPVALTYSPEDLDNLEAFCDTLSGVLGRIKNLRLILPEPYDDDEALDAAQYLNGILGGTAPILESLVVSDPEEIFGRVHTSVPILKSPMLRTIELNGFGLSLLSACAGSPSVKTLKISTPDTYERVSSRGWSYLTGLPALEVLSLYMPDVFTADIPENSPRLRQSVQQLDLQVRSTVLDALVNIEDLSRFHTLHISFLEWDANVYRLAALIPSLGDTTVLAAVHFGATYFFLLASDSAGRRRVFQHVILRDDWHTLLHNVTRLWLDAYTREVPPATKAVFPALEELTLDATIPDSPLIGDVRTPAWPSLACPRLRTVRFISENARPALPVGEVLDYLRRSLEFPARLERLVFDGVALTSEPGVDLSDVANTVEMVQSAQVPPESYRTWGNPWDSHSGF